MEFNPEIIEEIKSYVYMYSDPDTREPFYIGKGKGNRCFEHLADQLESAKVDKLKELMEKNKKPLIELLRYGLTGNEASLLEAALIDYAGLDKITNKVRGLHSRSFGRTFVEDIILKYTAEEVKIEENVLLITINRLYHSRISEEELYESTRGIWKVGKRRNKAELAFAVFQGTIREVYKISQWHKAGTLDYIYRDSSAFTDSGRWEFEGQKADEKIRSKYIRKSVRNYLSKGSQNPIKYINC